MEELKTIETYQEFKKALDTELYNQAEGFVRTGYLLKMARDTDILRESGYATVAEFAHAEYGLTKDVVSRYISINDRYSKNGYSEQLQEQYQGYGVGKLQDMLALPDAIIEIMTPKMTRKEIQEVGKEYKEEEENPLEIFMETPKTEQENMTTLQQAIHQHLHDNRVEFTKGFDVAMRAETDKEKAVNGILDTFAPSGVGIKTARIRGIGRVMISFRGKDAEIQVLNVRTQERQSYSWQQLIDELREVFLVGAEESGAEAWERIYEEEYEEKKEEVAPVQPSEEITELAAVVEEDTKEEDEEDTEPQEEQVPGQDNIMNHPEYLPESMKGQENHAGEISDKKEQRRAHEETHHSARDDSGRAETESERDGEGDVDTGAVTAPQEIQNVTEDSEIVQELPDSETQSENITRPENNILQPVAVVKGTVGETEEKTRNIWDNAEVAMAKVSLFFQNWSCEELEDGTIPAEALQNAYKNAISVAANLERMINNGKKHHAQ